MICRYQSWIAEAAVDALVPARQAEFEAHVAGCAACREALERERALQARIQGELVAMLSESPSAVVAARVRQRIADESSAGSRLWRWLPAAAGALAAAALVVWFLLPAAEETPSIAGSVLPESAAVSGPEAASPAAADSRAEREVPGLAPTRGVRAVVRGSSPPAAQEVIVPPGQWQAAAALYRAARAGVLEGASVVAQPAPLEARFVDLTIAELQVAPLEDAPERRPPGRG
jgi:hypothetical protein